MRGTFIQKTVFLIRDDAKTPRSPMGGRGGHQKSKNWTQKDTGEKGGGHKFLTARFMNKMYPFSQDYDYNHGLAVTSILSPFPPSINVKFPPSKDNPALGGITI